MIPKRGRPWGVERRALIPSPLFLCTSALARCEDCTFLHLRIFWQHNHMHDSSKFSVQ